MNLRIGVGKMMRGENICSCNSICAFNKKSKHERIRERKELPRLSFMRVSMSHIDYKPARLSTQEC